MRDRYRRGMYPREILQILADSADASLVGEAAAAEAASLYMATAQDTETLGPRPKLPDASENAASVEDISAFAVWRAKLNILRNASASLQSAASSNR